MFQNANFVVLLNNNVLTTNDVFSAQARGNEIISSSDGMRALEGSSVHGSS